MSYENIWNNPLKQVMPWARQTLLFDQLSFTSNNTVDGWSILTDDDSHKPQTEFENNISDLPEYRLSLTNSYSLWGLMTTYMLCVVRKKSGKN